MKTRDGKYQIAWGDSFASFDLDDYELKIDGDKTELKGDYEWKGERRNV